MELPRLLVLRIWNEPERFRALVRDLEPDSTHLFTDPEALFAYLRADRDDVGPASPPGEDP